MSQRHSSLVGRERVLAGWPCAARRGWPGVPPERRGPAPTAPAMPSHFHEKRVFLPVQYISISLIFDKARLSYANESRAYYHVARALDVALPNTRSGEGEGREGKDGLS